MASSCENRELSHEVGPLGCVNSPERSRRRDSRNLGPTFYPISLHHSHALLLDDSHSQILLLQMLLNYTFVTILSLAGHVELRLMQEAVVAQCLPEIRGDIYFTPPMENPVIRATSPQTFMRRWAFTYTMPHNHKFSYMATFSVVGGDFHTWYNRNRLVRDRLVR